MGYSVYDTNDTNDTNKRNDTNDTKRMILKNDTNDTLNVHHTICFSSFTVVYINLSINLDLQHWLRKTFTHFDSFYTLNFRLNTFSPSNNNYGDSFSLENYTFNFLYLDFYFIAQSWLHLDVPLYFLKL